MGIKALTSATLVPFALLFGRDAFKDFVFDEPEQAGGGKVKIPKNIPLVDDPLLGSYLKVMGLSVLDLSMQTLVPLGILMALYNLYIES